MATQHPTAPTVSVVMPVYNPDPAFLRAALESVQAQTEHGWEIIVVDDGSAQPQDWIAQTFAWPNLRLLRQQNGGPGSARNAGIAAAQGRYIALLDADDVWHADKLQLQTQVLQDHPHVGLVYSGVIKIDGDDRVLGQSRHPLASGSALLPLFWRNVIPTSTVMVRKSCLDEVGVFDEDRSLIAVEDYDLWLRVVARFEIWALPLPTTKYRLHAQGISRNVGRSYLGEIKVIEKAIERFGATVPQLRLAHKKRVAQAYFDWAEELFSLHRFSEARAPLQAGLKHAPTTVRAWLRYAASFLNAKTIERLRKAKGWRP